MQRVNIVGQSSSGKTTLARTLASRLGVPHVELDALFWGPNWTPVDGELFRRRVADALAPEAWVADGGYEVARDITWRRADTVVWLDYAAPVVLARYARRALGRMRSREELWPGTGNHESLGNLLGPDSLLRLIVRGHRAKRRRMEARLAARPDLAVVRLRSPAEARHWLESV